MSHHFSHALQLCPNGILSVRNTLPSNQIILRIYFYEKEVLSDGVWNREYNFSPTHIEYEVGVRTSSSKSVGGSASTK
jgi:hypothetical protein